jgi:hypothetical protein
MKLVVQDIVKNRREILRVELDEYRDLAALREALDEAEQLARQQGLL